MMRDAGQGQIDALRNLVGLNGLNDRDHVAMTTLEGGYEIPDPDTHEMTWKYVRTGDRAIVFVGPITELEAVMRYTKGEDTVTFEITLPAPESMKAAAR